jgi:hypothetical protein
MYVKIRVNDKEIIAMLDSGAMNTFLLTSWWHS